MPADAGIAAVLSTRVPAPAGFALESAAVGYVAEGAAYVSGVALIGAGLFLLLRGSFPGWWQRWFAWPLASFRPLVSRLQGAVAIGLGASLMLIVFTNVAAGTLAGILAIVALLAYVLAVLMYLVTIWLSHRGASAAAR